VPLPVIRWKFINPEWVRGPKDPCC
ncbi:hypothetical protein EJB05_07489, partial [Eragrostis curvula]